MAVVVDQLGVQNLLLEHTLGQNHKESEQRVAGKAKGMS
jgi:hypothetical protein